MVMGDGIAEDVEETEQNIVHFVVAKVENTGVTRVVIVEVRAA